MVSVMKKIEELLSIFSSSINICLLETSNLTATTTGQLKATNYNCNEKFIMDFDCAPNCCIH